MMRIVKLMFILLVVWLSMLIGFWIFGRIIIPLQLSNHLITGIVQTAISLCMAVIWLWGWRKLAYRYFWQEISHQKKL
jgi:hypothetical protein